MKYIAEWDGKYIRLVTVEDNGLRHNISAWEPCRTERAAKHFAKRHGNELVRVEVAQ